MEPARAASVSREGGREEPGGREWGRWGEITVVAIIITG